MQLLTLNAIQLAAFIDSESYKNLQNLPITPLRALSQCNNPCAEADDILLLLFYGNAFQGI